MYCTSPAESFGRHFFVIIYLSMLLQYSSGISVLGYLLSNKIKKNKMTREQKPMKKQKNIIL